MSTFRLWWLTTASLVFALLLSVDCARPDRNKGSKRKYRNICDAFAWFNSDLYRGLTAQSPMFDNKIFAPYGVNIMLGMVYASTAGATANVTKRALKLDGFSDSEILQDFAKLSRPELDYGIQLVSASKMFIKDGYPMTDGFVGKMLEYFNSEVEAMDLAGESAAVKINGWIEQNTNYMIRNVVAQKSLDQDTRIVLVNGIYFKGKWETPFEPPNYTKTGPFYYYPLQKKFLMTQFMTRSAFYDYGKISDLNAEAISLQYVGGRFTMIALLPDETLGFAELERRIKDGYDLTKIPYQLTDTYVDLEFPKFNIQSEVNFVKEGVLRKLGLKTIIGQDPNMGRLTYSPGLRVSDMYQKTFLYVTEEGTEPPLSDVDFGALPLRPVRLKFNRPFLGFIMDLQTKTVLFIYVKQH